jgi:hypothetical protein
MAREGGREGAIEADSIEPIGLPDITPELARESGFLGVLDLLKEPKYGKGTSIYFIRVPQCAAMRQAKRGEEIGLGGMRLKLR